MDVSWNPIDRLINRFGFWCLDDLRPYDPGGRCRVESELAAFVNSLPHDRLQMTEALTALGAECDGASEKMIDCVYRKRARTYARSTGEAAPLAIMDDIFLFHIAVPRNEEPLDVEVELTRTEEKIK